MMSDKENLYEGQVRYQIIRAIEMLLEQPPQTKEANRILESIYRKFLEEDHRFSLDSLVFSWFAQLAKDSHHQSEPNTLASLRKELLGQIPSTNIYALKYDFVQLLHGEALEAYQALKKLLAMRISLTSDVDTKNFPQEYKDLRSSLHKANKKLQPTILPELLILNASQVLLKLSYTSVSQFDIQDIFSIIGPVSSIETTKDYLGYVEGILRKLEGDAVLYVDIHLLPDGFVINFR